MAVVVAALVPPWLETLLTTPFFSTCQPHCDMARSECNMFCLDCPSAAAFCFYCRSSFHSDHRTVQIRRSSYHDVVRVAEIQKLLDIGGVQTYIINSARVMFLNERPQPRASGAGSTTLTSSSAVNATVGKAYGGVGSGAGGTPHICEVCSRTLLDPFRFCSLGCKLERIKREGDACFVKDENDKDDDDGDELGFSKPSSAGIGEGRRRRRRRIRVIDGVPGGGVGGGEDILQLAPPITASTSASARRRKGIPHRAPLAS